MFLILLIVYLCLCPLEAFKHVAKSRQANVCSGHKRGEFAENPKDCRQFYLCGEQGEATLASCPLKMFFNPVTKLCDKMENVQCNIKALVNLSNSSAFVSPTAEAVTSTSEPTKADQYCFNLYAIQRNNYALVFLPHPNNCQQYFMCYHGQALLQACSPKLHWNSKMGKCDLPTQAECSTKSNNAMYLDDLKAVEKGLRCPLYREHIFPNIERCDSFIYCVNGQAILQSCPFYQHFDVESGRCKWRINARCIKDLNLQYRSYTL